jgi:hypothetical protein
MAILNDYQGESIKINGVCYKFIGETTSSVNTTPDELGGTYASCLECALESSSSSSEGGDEPLEKIGPLNSDPRIKVTICWVPGDLDVTKNIFGKDWSRGESKILRPSAYSASGHEQWDFPTVTTGFTTTGLHFDAGSNYNSLRVTATADVLSLASSGSCTKFTNNLSLGSHYPTTCSLMGSTSATHITGGSFGFFTTNDGLTIKWEAVAGNAIGTDTWASWKGTTLSYATTLVNSPCP